MRNIILLLCMLVLLISFASALSVIVVKPLDAPTGITLANVSGTIPAGNYSIVLVQLGNMTPHRDTPRLESPPSEAINITLWTAGGIQINWTNSTNAWANGTNIYIRNVTTPYSASQTWGYVSSTGYGVRYGNNYTMSNYTVSTYVPCIWMTDTNSPSPSMPFGMNTTGGTGLVYLSGTSGTVYIQTIVNAINTSYGGTLPNTIVWDGMGRFYGAWTIAVENLTTRGVFDISGDIVWLWGGYYNPYWNGVQLKASVYSLGPTLLEFPAYGGSTVYAFLGNTSLNNTIISSGALGLDASYTRGTQITIYNTTEIWDSVIIADYPSVKYQRTFLNTKLITSNILGYYYGGYDINKTLDNLKIITGQYRWGESRTNDTVFKNLEVQTSCSTNYQIDMRFTGGGVYNPYFLNSKFTGCSDLPNVYWYRSYGYAARMMYLGNTLNMKVLMQNNTPITNANITMIANNGTWVFTQLTNSSGDISEQWFFHHALNRTAATNGYTDTVFEFAPYNISITATGYKTYSANNLNLSSKLDWTITLESQPAWNYSWIPEFKILNDTKHTILKIDNNGDLAIAGQIYENTNSPPPLVNIVWSIFDYAWLDDYGNLYFNKLYELTN